MQAIQDSIDRKKSMIAEINHIIKKSKRLLKELKEERKNKNEKN